MNNIHNFRIQHRFREMLQYIPVTIDLANRDNITDTGETRGEPVDCIGSALPLSTTKGQEVSVLSIYERYGKRASDMRIFYIQGLAKGTVRAGTEIDQTGDIIVRDGKEYRVKGIEFWDGSGITQIIGIHF